jgi:spore maturation protein CgeB
MELYGTPATVDSRAELAHDLTFIGSWRPERETLLEQLADFDLCIWGNDSWRTQIQPNSPLRKRWSGRAAIGREFAQICTASKISLNILDVVTWPGPNMRAFELPACGAFALMERTPALLEIFREGETVECFATISEARDKIAYYVTHEDQRQRIAQACHELVIRQGHTYHDRVRQMLT